MMTTVATILFTVMMATALLSLAWDLTRNLIDPEADDALASVRAEVERIAALPRERQPLRVIGRAAAPVAAPALAPVRRPMQPVFAAAA